MAVRLPGCVANLTVASYVELLAGGASSVVVRVDGCARREQVEHAVAQARQLVRATGADARVDATDAPTGRRRRELLELNRLPVSRRRLFMLALPKPIVTSSDDAPERDRLIAALRALRAGRDSELASIPAGIADLHASDCTGCGVCVKSCPAGALELAWQGDDSPPSFRLLFGANRCVDCGRCTDLCPQSALSRDGSLSWEALLASPSARVLDSGPARSCARCHAPFRSADDSAYCPVCAFRVANPFGANLGVDHVRGANSSLDSPAEVSSDALAPRT